MRMISYQQICATIVLAASSLSLCGQGRSGELNYTGVSDPMASTSITLLQCTSADASSPCTADQVAVLNRQIVESRKQHKSLSEVQNLDLGQHSWLKCSQMDGTACTGEQLSAVIAVASEGQARRSGMRLVKPVEMATR
jgi:hypothetical protein